MARTALKWILCTLAVVGLTSLVGFRLAYRFYTVPAESMMPTLMVGDAFYARVWRADPLKRGDVIVFRTGPQGDVDYVKRIAALPGDRIALREGKVVLNGVIVPQQQNGDVKIQDNFGGTAAARLFMEQFPGEASPHRIVDARPSPFDEFPEIKLPDDQYFVLGDNRDNSADSRVPTEAMGAGLVPGSAIVSKAEKIYRSKDRARFWTEVR